MAKPVLHSCVNGFCIVSKDDDGAGDNRPLVLLTKQRSLPLLLAASLTFNLSIDELITKPVSEPLISQTTIASSKAPDITIVS